MFTMALCQCVACRKNPFFRNELLIVGVLYDMPYYLEMKDGSDSYYPIPNFITTSTCRAGNELVI